MLFANDKSKLIKQKGATLLEIMLSLCVIAIILVAATRFFPTVNEQQKINNAVSQINGMIGGVINYTSTYPGMVPTIDVLVNNNFIPAGLGGINKDGKNVNPWGGDIVLNFPSDQPHMIELTHVPMTTTCKKLAALINTALTNSAACNGKGSLTVTFN